MNKFNPIYNARKATLSDVMFFYESINTTENLTLNINDFDSIFKSKLKVKYNQMIVLTDQQGNAAGCAIIEFRTAITDVFQFCEIQHFYIHPKYRKHAAAEALYLEIELVAITKKCFKISVSSLLNATINQRFYTKRGFKLIKKTYLKTVI
jgi:N-acetylglutamate synthase-like GNAT family acetyltransferase